VWDFRELLDEASIQLDTEWKDIRKLVKDDPRYLKFSSNERVSLLKTLVSYPLRK
jgi:hypothetical protein